MKLKQETRVKIGMGLMAFSAVGMAVLITVMWVPHGPSYHDHEFHYGGIIIGMNESRMAFYIETNHTVKVVGVDADEFGQYEVGDYYVWTVIVTHRNQGITNMTVMG